MTTDANGLVELMNTALGSTIPTAHNMGVRVVEARRGFAATTVPVEGNGNHFGVIYAGVQFTVAEILGGIICFEHLRQLQVFPVGQKCRHYVRRDGPVGIDGKNQPRR